MTTYTLPKNFDIETLTLGEIGHAETYSGIPMAALGSKTVPTTKLLVGIAYCVARRQEGQASILMTDAEKFTMKELGAMMSDGDDPVIPRDVVLGLVAELPESFTVKELTEAIAETQAEPAEATPSDWQPDPSETPATAPGND